MGERTLKIAYSGVQTKKEASIQEFSKDDYAKGNVLTQAYGLYKIASIMKINDLFGSNYVDSPQYLILSSQNNR